MRSWRLHCTLKSSCPHVLRLSGPLLFGTTFQLMTEILTAILVVITGWYAWVTYRILQSNQRAVDAVLEQNEALVRPYIVIRPFSTTAAVYYLSIKNTGKTAAQKLKLKIDRPFYSFDKDSLNIADAGLFTTGVTSFAPGAQIVYGLGFGGGRFLKDPDPERMPHQFTVTAEYSFGGKRVVDANAVDMNQFTGIILYASPEAKNLEKMRKAMESLASEAKRLRQDFGRPPTYPAVPHNHPLQADEGRNGRSQLQPSRLQRFIREIAAALRG